VEPQEEPPEIGGKERKGRGDREPGDNHAQVRAKRKQEKEGEKRDKRKKRQKKQKKEKKKQRKEREKGACSTLAVQKERVRERERCV